MTVETGCATCNEELYDRVRELMEWAQDCHMSDVNTAYSARDVVVNAAEDLGSEMGDAE